MNELTSTARDFDFRSKDMDVVAANAQEYLRL